MKRLSLLFACLLALIQFAQPVAAQDAMPKTMAYQGYLTNTAGDPANGSTSVTFRLYDQPSSGSALWSERQQGVQFEDGVFAVHLGSVESLEGVLFNRPLWLGVSVDGGQELRPRVALETVPFAMSVRGLRVEPGTGENSETPNVIIGHGDNFVGRGVSGGTISGGGDNVSGSNRILEGTYTTIGGGAGNEVSANYATVTGGSNNVAAGEGATVGGGTNNGAQGERATVAGGLANSAEGTYAAVGGGNDNEASGYNATIAGGFENNADEFGATVGGGGDNRATGEYSTISGGNLNRARGYGSTVVGGGSNQADGVHAIVSGGNNNSANGDRSFAGGYNAEALHDGAFVWAGYDVLNDPPFASTAPRQFLIRADGGVGIGNNAPQGPLHVTESALSINPSGFSDDALVLEGSKPVIGVYANFQGNTRPGLVLAGVDNGNVVDKWAIVREFFSGNSLHFTYGLNEDHTQNPTLMTLSNAGGGSFLSVPNGLISAERLRATEDLGSASRPAEGNVYRDNVVYAWAHVNSDGSVASSYGCTVSKSATGSYTVTFRRQLPNGTSAIVTPFTVNDPVIATAAAGASQANVATKVFDGAKFVPFDSGFYIQVVGRP